VKDECSLRDDGVTVAVAGLMDARDPKSVVAWRAGVGGQELESMADRFRQPLVVMRVPIVSRGIRDLRVGHPRDVCTQERRDAGLQALAVRPLPGQDQPMGVHGLHRWWYRCLANAGVVAEWQSSGEKMHKARHTAGQRVLDHTRGNLKAVQKLLGHSSISTTGDIYTDWDIDQLAETLRDMLEESET
jgi:integrase